MPGCAPPADALNLGCIGRLPIATEVELKLAAAAPDLPKLKRALLDLAPGSEGSCAALSTTYYDTPALDLQRRGLSLRVREADGRFVQTVKAEPAAEAGLLARGEWEDVIAGTGPDLRAPSSAGCLPEGLGEGLHPLFATAVKRTVIAIEPDPALRIEAAVDEGEIRDIATSSVAPLSEIELELKRGDAGALFDTALKLLDVAPLRIETRSKSERGYAIAAGKAAPPAPVHAQTPALDPAMSVETALRTVGRACLAHLLHNEAAALAGDPEGVHQMRVALRRISSALSAFKPMLPIEQRRWAQKQVARLEAPLGPARNLDVFAGDLLPPGRAGLSGGADLDRLAAAVEAARLVAHARVEQAILSRDHTEAVLRLLRWVETGSWREPDLTAWPDPLDAPLGAVAPQLLDHCRRALRKRSKGLCRQTAKQRHRVRIAVKRLRYTSELFTGLFDQQELRSFGRQLRKLQDDLGYASDVEAGRAIVRELCTGLPNARPLARAGTLVLDWHRRALAAAEPGLREQLRRLNRAAPFWRN